MKLLPLSETDGPPGAIHEATGNSDIRGSPAVEAASSRCIYPDPGVVAHAGSASSRSAGPTTAAACTRAVSRALHPILANVHNAIVGRGPPAIRASDAIAEPSAKTLTSVSRGIRILGIQVEGHTPTRVGANLVQQRVLALRGYWLRSIRRVLTGRILSRRSLYLGVLSP